MINGKLTENEKGKATDRFKLMMKTILVAMFILIVGFVMGYVSGLSIPKNIEFGIDEQTRTTLELVSNNSCSEENMNSAYYEKQYNWMLNEYDELSKTCDEYNIERIMCRNQCIYGEQNLSISNYCPSKYKTFFENSGGWYCDYE